MKMRSIKYFLKEGIKNVWSNGMMSLASILVMTCCMVLTGAAVLLSLNLSRVLKSVENKNTMTVFLVKGATASETAAVGKEIEQIPNILSSTYYSSNQASEKYKEVLGGLYEIVREGKNPFPEAFHITMKDLSEYADTVKKLESIKNVYSVSDRSETAKRLSSLNKLISTTGIWIVCSLGAVSMFIIANTIRLTMHSRRFEISIMKSVGATNGFIRAPFIIEGVIIGLLAAVISTFALNFLYDGFLNVIDGILSFKGMYFRGVFYKVFGCFTCVGLIFGVIGGMVSIGRYLRKEGGDFVAW